jgi:hypothetical protein
MSGRFERIDLVGQRYGALLVQNYAGSDGRNAVWNCLCDCGATKTVRAARLRCGEATSCGCVSRLKAREQSTRHGEIVGGRRSREYLAWQSMRSRCRRPTDKRFAEYGGRGIKICDRWEVFENFLADMGRKPSPRHSLDRYPDNNGNYEPGNCRWATPEEQNRNRRNTIIVECGYERIPLVEACARLKVDYFAVHSRMRKGATFAEAAAKARAA